MQQLLQDINEWKSSGNAAIDKIADRQIFFLQENLQTFIKQLAGED